MSNPSLSKSRDESIIHHLYLELRYDKNQVSGIKVSQRTDKRPGTLEDRSRGLGGRCKNR